MAVHAIDSPHRDPIVEQFLVNHGYEYVFVPDQPLAEITEDAPQVRECGLNPEWIETYLQALDRGDLFPAILLHTKPKGLGVVEGRHRRCVYTTRHQATIPAYVVLTEMTEMEVRFAGTVLNVRKGHEQTAAEKIELAIALAGDGRDQQSVSEELGLSLSVLKHEINKRRVDGRFEALNPPGWRKLSAKTLSKLYTLRSDPVLTETVKSVQNRPVSDVTQLVNDLNNQRSEKAQFALLQERNSMWAASRRLPQPSGRPPSRGPRTAFLQFSKSLLTCDAVSVLGDCLTDGNAQEIRRLASEVVAMCEKLIAST